MISILIATYNYNTFPLVKELTLQCEVAGIVYEILVTDDASTEYYDNHKISELKNCQYIVSAHNEGLSKTRNKLLSLAKYDWQLLLDSDMMPVSNTFIQNYVEALQNNLPIVYGGLMYKEEMPPTEEMLRWVYGRKREQIPAAVRFSKNPNHFLCSNVLLHRTVTQQLSFDEQITQYGYEDLVFNKKVTENGFQVLHIDNPTFHIKLDTSPIYLQKTKLALQTLSMLIQENKLLNSDTGISQLHDKLKKMKLLWLAERLAKHKKIQPFLEKNLTSSAPSLRYFDLYRLLFFTSLNKETH